MIFNKDDLPQNIKDLKAAEQTPVPRVSPPQSGDRRGIVFDVDNLPQELKKLQRGAPRNYSRPF